MKNIIGVMAGLASTAVFEKPIRVAKKVSPAEQKLKKLKKKKRKQQKESRRKNRK